MHILLVYNSYDHTAHEFRQYFFNEFNNYCKVTHYNLSAPESRPRIEENFDEVLARLCPDDKPDVVLLFTVKKCGYRKGLENFKGLIILYECDSESYHSKVVDYLNFYKNIRLAIFEFYPDCEWDGYKIEKLWLPPAVTPEDRIRNLDRIYDFSHCGSYAEYRGWHMFRLDFVRRVLPKMPWLKMEIRGERLESIGRVTQPILSCPELSIFANQTKIMFADHTKWRWLTHQYVYPAANGCLTIGMKPRGYDKQMIPECLVELAEGYADAEEKIRYYLEHEVERNALIKKAHDFVQQNHTIRNRVETLLSKIKEIS